MLPLRTQITLALAAGFVFITLGSARMQASDWKQLSPAHSPAARTYAAMAYDPVSQKIVLFGGVGFNGFLDDTWAFDGRDWRPLKTNGSPGGRAAANMAFDKPSGKLVLFGGVNGELLQDTWLFDGATSTWTQAAPVHVPTAAAGPLLFSQPKTGQALMFGGFNVMLKIPNLNDTYRWTGSDWEKLNRSTSPPGRGWGIAVTDPVRNDVLVAGGLGDTIRTDDTWVWSGSKWSRVSPATQVQALGGPGSAFDPDLGAVVVFGGFGVSVGFDVNDTWSWDGTNWTQLQTASAPSAREGVSMAYDPIHHHLVLFGGEEGNILRVQNDTWVLQ